MAFKLTLPLFLSLMFLVWGAQTYSQPPHTLTVNKSPSYTYGTVTVTAPSPVLSCDPGCNSISPLYPSGVSVTLTATPASGHVFSGWSGCDSVMGSDSKQCAVSVNSIRTVTANFSSSSVPPMPNGTTEPPAPPTITGAASSTASVSEENANSSSWQWLMFAAVAVLLSIFAFIMFRAWRAYRYS